MTVLTDLKVSDQFLYVAQVATIDQAGYHLTLYGPASLSAATALIDANGVMTGNLSQAPSATPVTVVTGFVPVSVGDVLVSSASGETLVARAVWITAQGVPMWANTPDMKVAYPATGWTTIGHVTL